MSDQFLVLKYRDKNIKRIFIYLELTLCYSVQIANSADFTSYSSKLSCFSFFASK